MQRSQVQADADDTAAYLAAEYQARGYRTRFKRAGVPPFFTMHVEILEDDGHWRRVHNIVEVPNRQPVPRWIRG